MQIHEKTKEYINVLKMARKPDLDEFTTTTKTAIAVMFIVGFIGFLIYVMMEIVPKILR
ncbi:MAG: protein translocase SEC61 complex subunit gamma [Archaeoglobales archaeon]|nr:MAG: protein translocase SEC61 complex subunit gamma [Archaeoglobales archaeon]